MVNAKLEIEFKDLKDFYGSLIKERAYSLTDAQIEAYVDKKIRDNSPAVFQIFKLVLGYFNNYQFGEIYLMLDAIGVPTSNHISRNNGSQNYPYDNEEHPGLKVDIYNPANLYRVEAANWTQLSSDDEVIYFTSSPMYKNDVDKYKPLWDEIGPQVKNIANKGVDFLVKRIIEATLKTPSQLLPFIKSGAVINNVWKFVENKEQLINLISTSFRQSISPYENFYFVYDAITVNHFPAYNPPVRLAKPIPDVVIKAQLKKFAERPKIDAFGGIISNVSFNKDIITRGIPRNIPGSGTITVTSNDGKSVEISVGDIKRALNLKNKNKN